MRIAITGIGSGIGLRAAALLAAHGHDVIGLVRSESKAASALDRTDRDVRSRIELIRLDLASSRSIRAAADLISAAGPLDALINNAAVFDQSIRSAQMTAGGHELFWATNHLGPTELTARLSPALAAAESPTVVFVASKGLITMPRIRIRFDDLDGQSWYSPTRAYYHAKLAQIMTASTLSERAGDGLRVACLRIPAVRLDADRLSAQPTLLRVLYAPKNRLAAPPERIAQVYADLVCGATPPPAVYVDEHVAAVPLPVFARDGRARERLWDVTNAAIESPPWAYGAANERA